jgi:hypothetical protein
MSAARQRWRHRGRLSAGAMSALITQKISTLFLDHRDRSVFLGISASKGAIEMKLNLAEARVLLVELERQIEAAMAPRSPIINDEPKEKP